MSKLGKASKCSGNKKQIILYRDIQKILVGYYNKGCKFRNRKKL